MEATVTFKATPKEFDLIRRALISHEAGALATSRDRSDETTPQIRRDAAAEAVATSALLEKVQ